MDVASIATGVITAVVAVPTTAWVILRKVQHTVVSDRAETSAVEWHERVIKRQDVENERLRVEIASLREAMTSANRRVLELELRDKVKEKIIRDLVRDIRLVKRDEIPLSALNTGIYEEK